MGKVKARLEALDGKVITLRTGKSTVMVETLYPLIEGGYRSFMYDNENCESPGVYIVTDGIEQIGNEIKFYDMNRRAFKLTIVEE